MPFFRLAANPLGGVLEGEGTSYRFCFTSFEIEQIFVTIIFSVSY